MNASGEGSLHSLCALPRTATKKRQGSDSFALAWVPRASKSAPRALKICRTRIQICKFLFQELRDLDGAWLRWKRFQHGEENFSVKDLDWTNCSCSQCRCVFGLQSQELVCAKHRALPRKCFA